MLKKVINKVKQSTLLKDNLVLFIGVFFAGIGGFLYHFIMGRMLGPAEYGDLGVLLSIMYIFLIILNAVQMGVAKITAHLEVKKQEDKISYLAKRMIKYFIGGAIGAIIVYLFVAEIGSSYIHVNFMPMAILSLSLFFILLLPVPRGIMQGTQKFGALSGNNVIEATTKLIMGVLLVTIGWGVSGAVGAIGIAYAVAFTIGLWSLRKLLKKKETKTAYIEESKNYKKDLIYIGCILTSLTLFYTLDVILVKHFFNDIQAGYYAALAIFGKVLFFGSSSIGQVMFPKVAALHTEKKPHKHILYKSAGLISLFIIPALICYALIPNLIVKVLFGVKFLEITSLLAVFGLYMGLFCFVYLFAYYFISIKKSWWFLVLLVLFNLLEVVLVYRFHETLTQVITVLILLSFSLLVILYGIFLGMKDA